MGGKEYCKEILNLLRQSGEVEWIKTFEYLITIYSTDKQQFIRVIKVIYAGSNSFNDLVLYKNGVLCIEENEKLADLRTKLFSRLFL